MPQNPYTSQSDSGYNASPPSDDGSQTAANEITWAGIKSKLADVLRTFATNINSQVLAAFGQLVITTVIDEENAIVAFQNYARR